MTDARLAVPVLLGWVVVMVVIGLPWAGAVGFGVATAGVLGALGVVVLVRRGRSRAGAPAGLRAASLVVPALLVIAALGAAVGVAAGSREPAPVRDALVSGERLEVVVVLEQTIAGAVAGEVGGGAGWRGASVDGRLDRVTDRDGATYAVSVPVRLLGVEAQGRWPLGLRLEGAVRLIPVEPGDDRVALARVLGELQPVRGAPPLLGATDALRERFLDLMKSFAGDGAALLPGLAIGDTSAVSDELDAAMKRSALSHLTAVSGANCAIVVGLVLGVGALLRWPRPVRIGVALAALGGFVLLVTPEPSVVRAAVMAAVVLLALASGRPAQGLPVLAVAVFGILVLDPWIARSYGFVLSVLATAALLVLAGPLAERLRAVMPAGLALWVAVPLAAQLVCQPVLILLAPEVPLTGVLANVLAAPAAPVATILGMIACLLAPLVPPLATVVAAVAWLPSAWIAGIATVASSPPGAVLPWPEGGLGALLLAVLTAVGLLALGVPARLGSVRLRRHLALSGAVLLVVVAGSTAGAHALAILQRPADWRVAQCDVGQGDALLVRHGGQVALIDTGRDAALLQRCLDTLGIQRLDLLVLTHFDDDHVGAVEVVHGRADRVLVGPVGRPDDEAVVEGLLAAGATVHEVAAGEVGALGGYTWRVLAPPDHRGVEPGNDASIVLEWRPGPQCAGCPSLLTLGDVGAAGQRALLGAVHPVDAITVAHHGAADQEPELYARASPALALIGVGADNGYGHPTPEALDAVAGAGALTARSDLHGLVLLAPGEQPGSWLLWTERGAVGRHAMAGVAGQAAGVGGAQ
ncbi:ComEC/Rec2 family competence protein [Microcella indica]|uniref:ComEC/Rec2 family competence protein n=1 Tax=Microcella indica TaxID=2750620 RepID=UPI0015CEFCF8|nr:ComEC/Rec2 family competence protein [Microcella indica]